MVNKCFACLKQIPESEFTCGRKGCVQALKDFEYLKSQQNKPEKILEELVDDKDIKATSESTEL